MFLKLLKVKIPFSDWKMKLAILGAAISLELKLKKI